MHSLVKDFQSTCPDPVFQRVHFVLDMAALRHKIFLEQFRNEARNKMKQINPFIFLAHKKPPNIAGYKIFKYLFIL